MNNTSTSLIKKNKVGMGFVSTKTHWNGKEDECDHTDKLK